MSKMKKILEKADLAISDLVNDGGYLVTAQSTKLVRHTIEKSVLLQHVKKKGMRAKKELIEGVYFTNSSMYPGISGQGLASSQRIKPTMTKAELDAKLVKTHLVLNDEVLEDNIEGKAFQNTVMDALSSRMSFDTDRMIANGDTTSSDDLLALFDGVLAAATSHVGTAGGTRLNDNILKETIKDLPEAARSDLPNMKFFTSTLAGIDYVHTISQRGDSLGAQYHEGKMRPAYQDIEIVKVPAFRTDLGSGSNESELLLMNPLNFNFGIWRKIKIETQRDAVAGILNIIVTKRIDGKYALEDYVAKQQDIVVQ